MTNTFREQIQRQRQWQKQTNLENRYLWSFRHLIRVMRMHILTTKWQRQWQKKRQTHFEKTFKEGYQGPLRHLIWVTNTNTKTLTKTWHGFWPCVKYWHFRQLMTWIHGNHCDLTIKNDTGQPSQFLRYFCKKLSCLWSLFGLKCSDQPAIHREICDLSRLRKSPKDDGESMDSCSSRLESSGIFCCLTWDLGCFISEFFCSFGSFSCWCNHFYRTQVYLGFDLWVLM